MKTSLSDDGKGALYACENCEWRGEAVLGGEWRGEPVLGSETLQIGDRIKVRGMSASLGMQTAWHTIQSLDPITVRVDGLADYLVRPRDVLESEVHSS